MLILITGGSSSGKSAFAEKMAANMRDKLGEQAAPQMVYIATMEPFSEDAAEKIGHHHELRAGKGFVTLEHYCDIEQVIPRLASNPSIDPGRKNPETEDSLAVDRVRQTSGDQAGRKKPVILLECLSNLLANEMFAPGVTEEMRAQPTFENSLCQKICAGLWQLEEAAACLIVVSCNVGEDGASYAWETVKYIHILGKLQAELGKRAAQVYEVVCGIPVTLKDTMTPEFMSSAQRNSGGRE